MASDDTNASYEPMKEWILISLPYLLDQLTCMARASGGTLNQDPMITRMRRGGRLRGARPKF
jgi:hypothetical protein